MAEVSPRADRTRLPRDRDSLVHEFRVDYYCITMTVGLYDDGSPGEIFLQVTDGPDDKDMIQGFLHGQATAVSLGLQYGVPLEVYVNRLKHQKFRPYGMTNDHRKGFERVGSIYDYIFRWLEDRFLDKAEVVTEMPARA